MDTMRAFRLGDENRHRESMVFDWEKAARLIRELHPIEAKAGLAGDWEYTGGAIYRDGQSIPRDKTYVYLASTWAKPEIEIDGQIRECFRMQSDTPGWDCDTYWPEIAHRILSDD